MASDEDQHNQSNGVITRRRRVSDVGPVHIPGVTLYNEDGYATTSFSPLTVEMRGPGVSAFGEVLTQVPHTEISAYFRHVDDPRVFTLFLAGTGSGVSNGSGMGRIATGTTIYSYANAQTVNVVSYEPGLGMSWRFTALWETGGVADTLQIAGPYHAEAGLAVGYNGTSWGFMHRHGRRLEIQALQVTTPAGGAENATITLNGTAHTVPLTAGAVEDNAREIAEFVSGYTDSAGLVPYDPWAVGDTVYFIRQTHGDATGTYSFSSATAVAAFTEFQTGAAGTQDWTPQASFSLDPLDGTGPSGMTLDTTKLNVFQFVAGWLGSLPTVLYVSISGCQRLVPVHVLDWTNQQSTPWCADPRLPVGYSVASLGATTDVAMEAASCAGFLQGHPSKLGPRVAKSVEIASVTTTELPLLAVMTATVDIDHNAINRRRLNLEEVLIVNTGTKDAIFRIYVGDPSNLTGYQFEAAAFTHSPIWSDIAATAITGLGEPVAVVPLNGAASFRVVNPDGRPFTLIRGQVLIVTGQTTSSSTSAWVGVNGYEDL